MLCLCDELRSGDDVLYIDGAEGEEKQVSN